MNPEINQVMSSQEVAAMIGTIVLGFLGLVGAAITAARRWVDNKFKPIEHQVAAIGYQTVNNHGPDGKDVNMRDQLDEIQEEMRSAFRRMDHQFGEVHDRHIETCRRVEGMENRASEEHARIWKAING